MASVELKKERLSVRTVADVCGGELILLGNIQDSESFGRVAIDSRDCGPDTMFCAIPGEKSDGFDYLPMAMKNGCRVVLCQRRPTEENEPLAAIVVSDTVKAMGDLARFYRSLFDVKVVAVTGSVGKTTTKEMIASVCATMFRTHKTEGNYNSVIGLPLTLFAMPADTQVAVLEMGMSQFGEISEMSRIAQPDIGVITCIGTAHMEYLGSREGICRAKMEIADGMTPGKSILFLPGAEPLLTAQKDHPIGPKYYSDRPVNEVSLYAYAWDTCQRDEEMKFSAVVEGRDFGSFSLFLKGQHNISNAMAAVSVGCALGIDAGHIRAGLALYRPVGMRQKLLKCGEMTVIEDCYNANPESMKAGLNVLMEYAAEKKCPSLALLGDMLELGEQSPDYHKAIGAEAARLQVRELYCFGPLSRYIAQGAREAGMAEKRVHLWEDINHPEEPARALHSKIKENTVLLVKASRGIAAERVIDELRNMGD